MSATLLERPPPVSADLRAFARRLKELTAGEPQGDVAVRLRYTQSRVSQVMRGERPSREFVERLCEAYALDRGEWLALAGYGPQPPEMDERQDIAIRAVEEALSRRD